jgi:hypothetical protein
MKNFPVREASIAINALAEANACNPISLMAITLAETLAIEPERIPIAMRAFDRCGYDFRVSPQMNFAFEKMEAAND